MNTPDNEPTVIKPVEFSVPQLNKLHYVYFRVGETVSIKGNYFRVSEVGLISIKLETCINDLEIRELVVKEKSK